MNVLTKLISKIFENKYQHYPKPNLCDLVYSIKHSMFGVIVFNPELNTPNPVYKVQVVDFHPDKNSYIAVKRDSIFNTKSDQILSLERHEFNVVTDEFLTELDNLQICMKMNIEALRKIEPTKV